jgi:mannose-6-phosphate isomerase-like protein (cupin superfamily)
MVEPLPLLIKASDIPLSENRYPGAISRVVRGDQHGLDVIIAVSSYPHGVGPPEHRHRCAEVFVVYEGRGVYTVDGVDVIAEPGDVVVAPANAWHSFRGDGEVPLRHVTVIEHAHDVGNERKPT